MYHNGLRYGRIAALVLFTHIVMLLAVLFRGNYKTIQDLAPLTIAVLGLDVVYIIVLRFFYKQMTYTTDFLLLLILNISVIFQSCFGGIGFAAKHYITCIMALICCQIMFLLTRNHIRLMAIKKYLYIVLGVIMLAILLLTGSRSMWIQIGPISLQPSEFMKPVFVLLCATSIMEQHEKTKVLFFYVSKEALFLTGSFLAIFVLQWWCRDLGSLPTFAAAYGCAVICRICYPKAKFSKTTLIFLCAVGVLVVIAAAKFAPGYVQDRLSVDIWNDMYGNGYQQCRALMAIAEGGLFGKGPGYGNLIEIAAADTDIVFSTICEEWGFLVALLVIFFIASLLILPMINNHDFRRCSGLCRTDGLEHLRFLQPDSIYWCYDSIHFTGWYVYDYLRTACRYAQSRAVADVPKTECCFGKYAFVQAAVPQGERSRRTVVETCPCSERKQTASSAAFHYSNTAAACQPESHHSDAGRCSPAASTTHAAEPIRAASESNPYHSDQWHTSAAGSTHAAEPIRAATESNPYHSHQWHTSAASTTHAAEPIRAAGKQNCSAEPLQQPICSPEYHPAFRQQPE